MIVGLGTDIIDNRRIEKSIIKFGSRFKKRCFMINEIKKSEKSLVAGGNYFCLHWAGVQSGYSFTAGKYDGGGC